MAHLGQNISFSNITGVKKSYPLPLCVTENCFILNESKNSLLKIHDKKLQHTWTLTYPHVFTSAAVFCSKSRTVYCVTDCKILRSWSLDEDSIEKAKLAKFEEPIFAVIPVPKQLPLLVFTSGKVLGVANLEENLNPIGKPLCRASKSELVWARTVLQPEDPNVLTVVYVLKKKKKHLLCSFLFDGKECSCYVSQELGDVDDVTDWDVNCDGFFYIIKKSGVFSCSLRTEIKPQLLPVPDTKDFNVQAIGVIDPTHIVISKVHCKCQELLLEVWDIKFVALKAHKSIKSSCISAVNMCVLDGLIFLSLDGDLMSVPIRVEKSTLANAVGKSSDHALLEEYSWEEGKVVVLSETGDSSSNEVEMTSEEQKLVSSTEKIASRLASGDYSNLECIPESELVELLRLALRKKFGKTEDQIIESNNILKAVFSAPFSEASILKFLANFKTEETMEALEILLSFAKPSASEDSKCQLPSDFQIYSWICLIIQSNMTNLRITKNKKVNKLLQRLSIATSEKISEYEDLESIQNSILLMQKDDILPEKHLVGKYSCETLNI